MLLEIVFLPEGRLGRFVLMGEIVLPAGAETNVPAPKAPKERFRVLVIVSAELAVLARVGGLLCHDIIASCRS